MESHIAWYKMQAMEVLKSFVDDTLDETLQQLETDCKMEQDRHLERIIEPLKPQGKGKQYLQGIMQSIIGAFFFALIVAAFAFIKTYSVDDSSVFSLITITQQGTSEKQKATACEEKDSIVVTKTDR